MAKQLPDELYIEIFKLTGENPMRFRVCKYFQKIIFDQFPFSEWLSEKLCRMIIRFNKLDLLKIKIVQDYPRFPHLYPISYSSYANNTSALKILLTNSRFDPSAENNEAIRRASYFGYAEVVRLLLSDPRVDPSAYDNSAIRCAYRNGHHEVVKLLLEDPRVYSIIDVSQFLKK